MDIRRNGFRIVLVALCIALPLVAGCSEEDEKIVDRPYVPTHDERFPALSASLRLMQGDITYPVVLQSQYDYLIRGTVFVRAGASLTIPPGTTVYGESSTIGTLVIDQGAKIYAIGTADAPILFTSDVTAGSRSAGDWGGIILNGKAQVNVTSGGGGTAQGEGDTGTYGGTDDHDCSGVLMYVVVQFAGKLYSPDNELNGIAFQAVGDRTVVMYCQVHRNADDAFEWFGGTVNAKYLVASACEDDHIDWTHGARFMLQYAVVDQNGASNPDRGIEADNYEFGEDNTPRSHPILSNVLFWGSTAGADASGREGIVLRRGTEAEIYNSIIMDFDYGLEIDSDSTFLNANNSTPTPDEPYASRLTLQSMLFHDCITSPHKNHISAGPPPTAWQGEWDVDYFTTGAGATAFNNNVTTTGGDGAVIDTISPGKYNSIGDALTNPVVDVNTVDSFFDTPVFIGGVAANYEWLDGWTSFPTN